MVKFCFAGTVPPFFGKMNLDEGMFVFAAMTPIGAGLHDPVSICLPLVMGRVGTVAQKLMKLLLEVREATWPASTTSCPFLAKPVAMTELSRVRDDCASPPSAAPLPAALLPAVAVAVQAPSLAHSYIVSITAHCSLGVIGAGRAKEKEKEKKKASGKRMLCFIFYYY